MSEEEFTVAGAGEVIVGEDISLLSIEELEKRIILFEQEIGRIRMDIAAKKISIKTAESIFRS